MNNKSNRKTCSYREGTIITVSLIVFGFVLQIAGGGASFRLAGFPWNLVSGVIFLGFLLLLFWLQKKYAVIKWLGGVKAALPAIFGFTFLVLLMGFVKQDVPSKNSLIELSGINHLIKTWPFFLINLYLLILLGLVTLKRLTPFNVKNFGFFLNHFGLFLVLFSTTLGSSDVKTLNMNCYQNQTEWRGREANGTVWELPIAIKLLNFNIEEFRPKLTIIDNNTGKIVIENSRQQVELLDRDAFDLFQYHLEVETFYASSGRVEEIYYPVNEPGSAPSANIKVTNLMDQSVSHGWVCSGSYAMQPAALKLNENHSLIMLSAEPKKFSSEVSIVTKDGKSQTTRIEVNKPFSINGWTIYQLGYNTEMGRWSDLSVLQLVRDPWLPAVYAGIFLMMAGAIFLFIFGKPKSGGTEHVA